ncbi:hypothetical protein ABZ760_25340 [Streptomyces sp. NPDC006658]|uniref:hypothetical protein n=1 Tax=Streptomyces sp. NPDC006658 TaxID=3156900 RepID=UPI0033D20D2F
MRNIRNAALGIAAGVVAAASVLVPVNSASADGSRCAVTSPWGVKGYRLCGSDPYKDGYVDWDRNGTTDEVFVIAPNYTIWHTWKAAGRWVEMPGNGRADGIQGPGQLPPPRGVRCFIVTVSWKSYPYYQNCYYDGKWHNWTTSG